MQAPDRRRFDNVTYVLSTEGATIADRATIEDFGIPGFTLMECAARGAADAIEAELGTIRGSSVAVLAGPGNNGGDGLAVARILHDRGARVVVMTVGADDRRTPDNARNLGLLQRIEDEPGSDLELRSAESTDGEGAAALLDDLGPFDLCVDALLGIGGAGPLREPIRTLATWSQSVDTVVALDVPTGIDSDTGAARDDAAVLADLTVTMIAPKLGLLFADGAEAAGDVVTVEIGVPRHILESASDAPGCALVATEEFIETALPPLPRDAHKYSVGQAAVVAGSDEYAGAAVLASTAAARVGAGYVVCSTTARAAAAIDARDPSIATAIREHTNSVLERTGKANAFLIGPGLGSGTRAVTLVRELLERVDVPLVLDADGLNAIADEEWMRALPDRRSAPMVLTPHLGEFRRLVEASGGVADALDLDRRTWLVQEWAQRWRVVLVLKGAPTVVAAPDGVTFIEPYVEPALATAGSGDVLAGMITGLLAQGVEPLEAAVCALRWGAWAAASWCESNDARSMTASDLVEELPRVSPGSPEPDRTHAGDPLE